jgi:hypothetical protein
MRRTAALLLTAGLVLATPTAAFAGKPSPNTGGGKGGKPSGGTSSMTLVLLDSTDGVPHWGQHIRFDVSTTATTEPHVSVKCSQGGTVVYSAQTGYYDSYPWPSTQTFTLSSNSWTAGDADCNAAMYYFDGSKTVTAATLAFHVYA